MHADRRHENRRPAHRPDEIPRGRGEQRRDDQAVEQRLDEPQERQLEQEEGDVAAEDQVGDRGRGRERNAVLPEQHGLPGRGQRARDAEREEDDQPGEHPRRDRAEVREVVGVPGGPRRGSVVGRAPATGAAGARTSAASAASLSRSNRLRIVPPPGIGGGVRRPASHRLPSSTTRRQHEPEHEQPDLRGEPRPVHVRVADALEPQRIGPDLDAERERDQRQDDERREPIPSERPARRRRGAEAAAVVRTAGLPPADRRGS